ncbi:hypothetical protein F6Q07_21960 [Pectobacterium parmentieri]|nr:MULTISPECIES: hypothetical protein [Pectobacterium]MBI0520744.1 hypothetical protein [Pectobacterium parmentieri]RRO09488.1 hypothetical protein DMB81_005305 [Pectobacterium aquaticum]
MGLPNTILATYDAPCVFFYVVMLSYAELWWAGRGHRKVRRFQYGR